MRGNYSGSVECYFQSKTSGKKLADTSFTVNQIASQGWRQTYSPTSMLSVSAASPNNTFYFTFDGTQLAGKSLYFNLFSVFKQTYHDRNNGVREDLAEALITLVLSRFACLEAIIWRASLLLTTGSGTRLSETIDPTVGIEGC
jgi:alpha-N-arabinofuranosidase